MIDLFILENVLVLFCKPQNEVKTMLNSSHCRQARILPWDEVKEQLVCLLKYSSSLVHEYQLSYGGCSYSDDS